jgi:hypothetical protein
VYVKERNMWPYNHCEWKIVTYGAGALRKAKEKARDNVILLVLSVLPSALMIIGLFNLIK